MTIEDCHTEAMDCQQKIEDLQWEINKLYQKADGLLDDMDKDDEEYENCKMMVEEIDDIRN